MSKIDWCNSTLFYQYLQLNKCNVYYINTFHNIYPLTPILNAILYILICAYLLDSLKLPGQQQQGFCLLQEY